MNQSAPRLLYYSHDTYGLGHLRRTLALARYLRLRTASLSQLIVTGSPIPHYFSFPDGSDYVKLPSVVKVGVEDYLPRALCVPLARVWNARRDIMLSAARRGRPRRSDGSSASARVGSWWSPRVAVATATSSFGPSSSACVSWREHRGSTGCSSVVP